MRRAEKCLEWPRSFSSSYQRPSVILGNFEIPTERYLRAQKLKSTLCQLERNYPLNHEVLFRQLSNNLSMCELEHQSTRQYQHLGLALIITYRGF